jgi:hypothetical protein
LELHGADLLELLAAEDRHARGHVGEGLRPLHSGHNDLS